MKAPVSWIREYVDLPADLSVEDLRSFFEGDVRFSRAFGTEI